MSNSDPRDDGAELSGQLTEPAKSPVPMLLAAGRVSALWIGSDGEPNESGQTVKAATIIDRAVQSELAELTGQLIRKPLTPPDGAGEVRWLADGGARNALIKLLAKRLRQHLDDRGPIPVSPNAPTRTILGELVVLPTDLPSSSILATLHEVYQRLKEYQRQQRTVRFRWTVTARRSDGT